MKPIFLLGVGCQKGGTTWLYDYLYTHAEGRLPRPKELHVLDTMFRPDLFRWYEERYRAKPSLLTALISKIREAKEIGLVTNGRSSKMIDDLENYKRFFVELSQNQRLVADITPEYATLCPRDYLTVYNVMKDHFDFRVIFIMRDPVERVWSAAKMKQEMDTSYRSRMYFQTAADRMRHIYWAADTEALTRYDQTIANLEEVIPSEQILYCFYEELFDTREIARICDYLEISAMNPDLGKRVNASGTGHVLNKETRSIVRRHYSGVYDYCAEKFGHKRIANLWQNY